MVSGAYLNLKSLLGEHAGTGPAGAVASALQKVQGRVPTMTLDLAGTKGLVSAEEVESLVALMRSLWPRPAFCLTGEADIWAWGRAAAGQSQPLLYWSPSAHGGYMVFGRAPAGDYATLLRALCTRHPRASAEQLARDPLIVSPNRVRFDSYAFHRYAVTGRFPTGPTPADAARIANDLRNMARQRYILEVAPGIYSAVRPTPPVNSAVPGGRSGR